MNTFIQQQILTLIQGFNGEYDYDIFKKILLMTHPLAILVQESLILPPKITTQTIIAELSSVCFNENNIEVEELISAINTAHKKCNLNQLRSVKTKRFVLILKNAEVINCELLYIKKLGKRPMNSSILFSFESKMDINKQYHLRVFRNGKIQIPGVAHSKGNYEIKLLIWKISECLACLLQQSQFRCVNFHIVMTNYKSIINLRNGLKIDVLRMIPYFYNNMANINSNQCQLIQSSQVRGRPVLHLKFQIEKMPLQYERENIFSTSRKRKVKTITVQLMQSGKLLLQGCVQDNTVNFEILLAIESALQNCLQQFIVTE